MTIFLCEDSPDGILSAVYEAYASKLGVSNIRVQLLEGINYELFQEYLEVKTDVEKAVKVACVIRKKLGKESWKNIYQACLTNSIEKADAVFRTIYMGIHYGRKNIMENLSEPSVFQVFSLSRKIANEAHRYLGFVRFREMEKGFLFSEISPENQILPLIGDHFSNRFPKEAFLIEDRRHETCLVHEPGRKWFLVRGLPSNQDGWKTSEREAEYVRLWRQFHQAVSIEERKNLHLQQHFLPYKFRVYMTESF